MKNDTKSPKKTKKPAAPNPEHAPDDASVVVTVTPASSHEFAHDSAFSRLAMIEYAISSDLVGVPDPTLRDGIRVLIADVIKDLTDMRNAMRAAERAA